LTFTLYSVLTLAPVSRITARSHNLSMQLTLDIANELYPLTSGETFTLALARSLSPEEELAANGDEEGSEAGGKRVKKEMWRSEDQGLAADYEYVMYGKVSERARGHRLGSFGIGPRGCVLCFVSEFANPGRVRCNSAFSGVGCIRDQADLLRSTSSTTRQKGRTKREPLDRLARV
jgi:hypothetical protein